MAMTISVYQQMSLQLVNLMMVLIDIDGNATCISSSTALLFTLEHDIDKH